MKLELMDSQYEQTGPEIKHLYGPNVHILNDLEVLTALSVLGRKDTKQPQINGLVSVCCNILLNRMISGEFERELVEEPTRMEDSEGDRGIYRGPILATQQVVCVNLMRAGLLPSHIAYERLARSLGGDNVTQHHVTIARKVDEKGQVKGADISALKLDQVHWDKYIALFCDPMGATGSSMIEGLDIYHNKFPTGVCFPKPEKKIGVHLVITPEYIKHLQEKYPDTIIYTGRLDRGLSNPGVLRTIPGTYPDKEIGLNGHQYIVPGLGGVGEIINNTQV